VEERPPRSTEPAHHAALAQIGLEMVAPIAVGLWLDYRFGTLPWLTLVGVAVGFIGGMVHLIWAVNRKINGPEESKQRGAR
jgi:ATP synthase protein I